MYTCSSPDQALICHCNIVQRGIQLCHQGYHGLESEEAGQAWCPAIQTKAI